MRAGAVSDSLILSPVPTKGQSTQKVVRKCRSTEHLDASAERLHTSLVLGLRDQLLPLLPEPPVVVPHSTVT